MSIIAKAYINIKVKTQYILENINVGDDEFKNLVLQANNSFVPLNDLVLYFWYYRQKISKDVMNKIFETTKMYFGFQEEPTTFPTQVEINVKGRSAMINRMYEDFFLDLDIYSYEDKLVYNRLLNYFYADEDNKIRFACMPIKEMKLLYEEYYKCYPEQVWRVENRVFDVRLNISFKK